MTVDDLKKLYRGGLPQDVANVNRVDGDADGFAAIMALADGQMGFWAQQSRVGTATGVYLDQHGRDRGLRRKGGETDEQYRSRLRLPPAALTVSAIFNAVADLLGTDEVIVIELPLRSAYFDRGSSSHGFLDRGDRMGGGRGMVIVLIPAGGTQAEAVRGLLRSIAAAGKLTRVEEYT